MNRAFWILFVFLCLGVSVYPLMYLLAAGKVALLQSKSDALFANTWWRVGFYTHIVFGGIALAVGWAQFVPSWRNRNIALHRALGKLYVLSVALSGITGVGIAFAATTGAVAGVGFGSLGVFWLYTTWQAYNSIKQRNIQKHENMMIYSYSACFAGVMLRLWMPLFLGVFHMSFMAAYPIIAWLCWVPNIAVGHWIVLQKNKVL